jgi:hypothetical protein
MVEEMIDGRETDVKSDGEYMKSNKSTLQRTTQAHIAEMLRSTLSIIACTTCSLKWAQGEVGLDVMTVCHGAITPGYVVTELWMVAVRLECS